MSIEASKGGIGLTTIANPFTQLNVDKPSSSSGHQGSKNVLLLKVLNQIIQFSNQKTSMLLSTIENIDTVTDMGGWLPRVGEVEWSPITKQQNDSTPSTIEVDRRGFLILGSEFRFRMDRRFSGSAMFSLSSVTQMKASEARGRNIDKFVLSGLVGGVTSLESEADATSTLVQTSTVSQLPDSQLFPYYEYKNSQVVWKEIDNEFLDRVAEKYETDTFGSELYGVLTPKLRRKLKQIASFRNKESTLVMLGDESDKRFRYNGINWVTVSAKLAISPQLLKDKYLGTASTNNGVVASSSSNKVQVTETIANGAQVVAFYSASALAYRFHGPSQYIRVGPRLDYADANELYMTAGDCCVRMIDEEVIIGFVKA